MIAIDTNILVYAHDGTDIKKNNSCKRILTDIYMGERKGVVTNQILVEFANVVMNKLKNPLTKEETRNIIGAITTSAHWKIINYNSKTIMKALEKKGSFWDNLIVSTLVENQITSIVTENIKDFKNGPIKPVPMTAW